MLASISVTHSCLIIGQPFSPCPDARCDGFTVLAVDEYPFIELSLGLGYLSHWQPRIIYTSTVIVMIFGSFGVINALRKGLDVDGACLGTVLKVLLSIGCSH